jgi:hypothetical protein
MSGFAHTLPLTLPSPRFVMAFRLPNPNKENTYFLYSMYGEHFIPLASPVFIGGVGGNGV